MLVGCQHHVHRVTVGRIRVATSGGAALTGLGQFTAVIQSGREPHGVGAGLKIRKEVIARAIGRVGADGDAAAIEECDGDASDARLVGILHAVFVQVLPDVVAQAGQIGDVARIPCGIIFTGL